MLVHPMLKAVASSIARALFAVKAFAARLGYYRRRKQRELQKYPVRWLTPESIIFQDLSYVRDEEGGSVVGDRFLDIMYDARKGLLESISRRSFLSLTIGAYIALTILGVEFPMTLGGFGLKRVPGLTEGLLVLADLIGLSVVARMVNLSVVSAAIKGAIAGHVAPSVQYFYRSALIPNELPLFFLPTYLPHITWGSAKSLLFKLYIALAFAFIACIILSFLAFRLWAFLYILDHPSISHTVSIAAIGITVFLDVISIAILWMFLFPLPHRDWQLLQEMELSDQFSPDKGEALRRAAYKEDVEDMLAMQRKGYLKPEGES